MMLTLQEKLATPNIWSKEELRDAAARDFGETEEKVDFGLIPAKGGLA